MTFIFSNKFPWSLSCYTQVEELQSLVAQHTKAAPAVAATVAAGVATAAARLIVVVNWPLVSLALRRVSQECRNKWGELADAARYQGPFTEAENVLIQESVANWRPSGKRKMGLWVSLERDLDRPSKKIRDHWRYHLLKRDDNSNNNTSLNS